MRRILPLFAVFLLVGCITQAQADQKLADGCQSGIKGLLESSGKNIKEVKTIRYANEENNDGMHRRITIEAVEQDGWLELEKEYSCLFMQEWGLFKSYHRAALAQIILDEELIGKKDGVIHGDVQTYLKLVESIDQRMHQ
ncbi:MAG: hypothetical protein AAGB32_00300 [Pseudomonadota bacterium]